MPRLVTVMPTWAPDSWVDSDRSPACTPSGRGVTVGCGAVDLVAVDGDERELGGDEEAAQRDQQERDREQYPGGHPRPPKGGSGSLL